MFARRRHLQLSATGKLSYNSVVSHATVRFFEAIDIWTEQRFQQQLVYVRVVICGAVNRVQKCLESLPVN